MRVRQSFLAVAAFLVIVFGASAASAQGVHLFAVLNGGNEVTNQGQANQGDPNGHGAALVIIINNRRICFAIAVHRIDTPTAAHIHAGKAGTNGGIVIGLAAPNKGNNGTSSGCVGGLDPADVRAIRNAPSEFYVNVHTNQFPSGALRGQLF